MTATRCVICGEAITLKRRRKLCGSHHCQRERDNSYYRRYWWKRHHGQEPPSRDTYPKNCAVCGKPLDQSSGPPIKFCSHKCYRGARDTRGEGKGTR